MAEAEVVWSRAVRTPGQEALLDPAERHRLAALRSAPEAARFVAAHALLRVVVGRRVGVDPAALEVSATCRRCGGPHGVPRVAGHPDLHLSLSHAGDRVVLALGCAPLGVDVEATAAAAFPGFSAVALAAGEQAVTDVERAVLWTRKEAVLKATGHGLAVPPTALTVSAAGRPPALLGWDPRAAGVPAPGPVVLADLDLGTGYAGCVAVLATGPLTVQVSTERLSGTLR